MDLDTSCPPQNPAYAATYGSTNRYQQRNHEGSGGGNAVASGLGGFAFGAVVGALLGGRSNRGDNHHNMPMFGSGNDGGYDIIGDSRDNNSGGYDIQGDSGGYDIQGDS